jgi:hypothetical protein
VVANPANLTRQPFDFERRMSEFRRNILSDSDIPWENDHEHAVGRSISIKLSYGYTTHALKNALFPTCDN